MQDIKNRFPHTEENCGNPADYVSSAHLPHSTDLDDPHIPVVIQLHNGNDEYADSSQAMTRLALMTVLGMTDHDLEPAVGLLREAHTAGRLILDIEVER